MAINEQILALAVIARDEATATLTRVNGALGQTGLVAKETSASMGLLNSALSAVPALAALAGFTAITGFLVQSANAAKEEEAGIRQLTASLHANVAGWDGNTAAIEQAVRAREQLGFSDDEIRSSLSLLVGATHNVNEAFSIQNVAMDLARFRNISLQEATTALVTIEAGRARGLANLGINVKDYATTAERLAAVEQVAGGQAAAFSSTTEGAFARAGTAIHDLQETIGAPLLNALALVAQAAADAARGLEDFIGKAQELIDTAGKIKDQGDWRIPVVADAIDLVTGAFHAARDPADQWMNSVVAGGRAAQAAAGAADGLTGSVNNVTGATATGAAAIDTWVNILSAGTGAATTMANTVQGDVEAVASLTAALNSIPTFIPVEIQLTVSKGEGVGALPNQPLTSDAQTSGLTLDANGRVVDTGSGAHGDTTEADNRRRKAQQAADEARRKAEADARAAFAAQEQAAREAFAAAKQYGDDYYDEQHQKALRAIKDAHDQADARIKGEKDAADAALAAQKIINAQPVTAAEAALNATENQERLRDLTEAVQTAQASGDQKSIRDAFEALANFEAQLNIDRLKDAQSLADAQAQLTHDNTINSLNQQQTAEDKSYAAQVAAEDKRYRDQKQAFDREEKQLADHLDRILKAHKNIHDQIEALYKNFGIPVPKAASQAPVHIESVLQVDGKEMARVVSQHQLNDLRAIQPAPLGSAF